MFSRVWWIGVIVWMGVVSPPALAADEATDSSNFQWIRTEGMSFVDEAGNPVILKGCNVGNWLLLEMWMLCIDHGKFPDQYAFEQNLVKRFGQSEKNRLMEMYRENWIRPRDFEIIRSFGFNVIRLPFNYRLLEDDERPFELKEDAFKWLDRAIDMAEAEGIYVILDMHGVPGGQSIDHPTGRVEQNKLWHDPIYAKRAAHLWKQIANRYKDRPSIAGYDVINEPYNDFSGDIRPQLRDIFHQIYQAIRSVDQRHVIFAPAPLWGGHTFYGNVHDNGWTQVAFTEHHYPGLFGSEPSLRTHANFIYRTLPEKQKELEALGAPLFVGEWNPVFEKLGGGNLMRRYFDEYAQYGWAATIWSYKILHPEGGVIDDNWYMVSNAEPLNKPVFATAPLEEIEAYFKWFGTMKYVIDEPMREALTRPDPVPVALPEPAPRVTAPPFNDQLTGWAATDIGEALPSGQKVESPDSIIIYGGGSDIWNEADQFRFVWREVTGDFTIQATLHKLGDTHLYAKAGLMARVSTDPSSAHVLVHPFPSGKVALGWRSATGQPMKEIQTETLDWPIFLRLTRRGAVITGEYSQDGQAWHRAGEPVTLDEAGDTLLVGPAVLSHDNRTLTDAVFTDIRIETAGSPQP